MDALTPAARHGRAALKSSNTQPAGHHSKTGYYLLEGVNAFAATFFFVSLMYLLHVEHHFNDLQKLAVGAIHGLLYIPGSWYAGRFAQRRGYFQALMVGFIGMSTGIGLAALWNGLPGLLIGAVIWTVGVCFTWAPLEALVSENEAPHALADRVGLYNVVWAMTGALGGGLSRWVFEALGPMSMYWVPLLMHAAQLASLPALRRHHARRALETAPNQAVGESGAGAAERRPAYFRRLAWLANPFSYMAINTVMVVAPTITQRIGLPSAAGAMWASTWLWSRTAGFLLLWKWPGWHYRFDWFLGAFLALLGGFVGTMLSRELWQFIALQVVFGGATALIYYSALFYAMDGSDTHGEHGGVHEAIIGAGICGGPAVSAVTLLALPGNPTAPAWVVSFILGCGLTGILVVRRNATVGRNQ